MERYFGIRYEFDRGRVKQAIAQRLLEPGGDYICVADGVVLDTANRDAAYRAAVNGGMFSICDSGYVPLYLRLIYGRSYGQYCGSEIFMDIVGGGSYRMMFLGALQATLEGLRSSLMTVNPAVAGMRFWALPYQEVGEFDYAAIAREIEADGAEIVWVALGAPKQELFMSLLKPHLSRGVMIAVGAVFKFYSGVEAARAPGWMVRCHLEFVYRIAREPRKQLRRCWGIVSSLPRLLVAEMRRKHQAIDESAGAGG